MVALEVVVPKLNVLLIVPIPPMVRSVLLLDRNKMSPVLRVMELCKSFKNTTKTYRNQNLYQKIMEIDLLIIDILNFPDKVHILVLNRQDGVDIFQANTLVLRNQVQDQWGRLRSVLRQFN